MKLKIVIWNTSPTSNIYFCASSTDSETSMLEHGWTLDHVLEIEFEPRTPDIAGAIAAMGDKINETQAAAHKACELIRNEIRKLQTLTYEETNK